MRPMIEAMEDPIAGSASAFSGTPSSTPSAGSAIARLRTFETAVRTAVTG
jgi:hypothetical protein